MLRTNPVEFESVAHRQTVHDAVRGRATALSENTAELRALFDVGQTLAAAESVESYTDHGAMLEIPFAFESRDDYHRAITILTEQTDENLVELGQSLAAAGIDTDFDAARAYGIGGVREAVRRR